MFKRAFGPGRTPQALGEKTGRTSGANAVQRRPGNRLKKCGCTPKALVAVYEGSNDRRGRNPRGLPIFGRGKL
jgi:hypothetical protein